jgi:mycothiol system anti-sigma-R factor
MTCEDVLTRLWEYLDEELAPEEVRALGVHLGGCSECHGAFCCDRAFLSMISRLRCVRAPAPLTRAVLTQLSIGSSASPPL